MSQTLMFDLKLMKVGCPLLQAAHGGAAYLVSGLFDTEDWTVIPTPNLRGYQTTREQAEQLAEKLRKRRLKEK